MAFDEGVAERLREVFAEVDGVVEKKMFGGLAFLVAGNMCCGIVKDELMVRVGKERHAEALARPHAREMDFTGRSLGGFAYVGPDGFAEDEDLEAWVAMALSFASTLPAK